jgi:hypothetical protein
LEAGIQENGQVYDAYVAIAQSSRPQQASGLFRILPRANSTVSQLFYKSYGSNDPTWHRQNLKRLTDPIDHKGNLSPALQALSNRAFDLQKATDIYNNILIQALQRESDAIH